MVRATSGSLVYTSLYYYTDLANGSQYRPSANVVAQFMNEDGQLDGNKVFIQFWDGAGWNLGISTVNLQNTCVIMSDSARYVQISNTLGSAQKISLTGYNWA